MPPRRYSYGCHCALLRVRVPWRRPQGAPEQERGFLAGFWTSARPREWAVAIYLCPPDPPAAAAAAHSPTMYEFAVS